MQRFRALVEAIYRLYEHSGFSMAGAIAFSFVVALFPFCIFLGALSGLFGGREVAAEAIHQLFLLMPTKVAEALAPEVDAIMSTRRVDLLTVSGGLTLFFATSANETLRAALNLAYRVKETRTYPLCWFYSAIFVIIVSVATLTLTAVGLFGPMFAAQLGIEWLSNFLDQSWFALTMRYLFATIVIAALLFGAHLWIAGGQRTLPRCVSRRHLVDTADAGGSERLFALLEFQRLQPLLCRPVATDGGADLLPGDRLLDPARRRTQSRLDGVAAGQWRVGLAGIVGATR